MTQAGLEPCIPPARPLTCDHPTSFASVGLTMNLLLATVAPVAAARWAAEEGRERCGGSHRQELQRLCSF